MAGGGGRAMLPRLTLPRETWVAAGVGSLSERAEAFLRTRASGLRHLVDLDGSHICELELYTESDWRPPPESRWVTLDELRDFYGDEWGRRADEAIERWF